MARTKKVTEVEVSGAEAIVNEITHLITNGSGNDIRAAVELIETRKIELKEYYTNTVEQLDATQKILMNMLDVNNTIRSSIAPDKTAPVTTKKKDTAPVAEEATANESTKRRGRPPKNAAEVQPEQAKEQQEPQSKPRASAPEPVLPVAEEPAAPSPAPAPAPVKEKKTAKAKPADKPVKPVTPPPEEDDDDLGLLGLADEGEEEEDDDLLDDFDDDEKIKKPDDDEGDDEDGSVDDLSFDREFPDDEGEDENFGFGDDDE